MRDSRYCAHVAISEQLDSQLLEPLVRTTLMSCGLYSFTFPDHRPENRAASQRYIIACDLFLLLLPPGLPVREDAIYDYLFAHSLQKPVICVKVDPAAVSASIPPASADLVFQSHVAHLLDAEKYLLDGIPPAQLELALRQQVMQYVADCPDSGWHRTDSQQAAMWHDERQRLLAQIQRLEAQLEQPVSSPAAMATDAAVEDNELDRVQLHFGGHLYMMGNFQAHELALQVSWQQLLKEIGPHFSPALPEESFRKILNQYLSRHALALAQAQYPDTHAVSRVEIRLKDLHLVKAGLRRFGWILPGNRDERGRILWELSVAGSDCITRMLREEQDQPRPAG